MQSFFHQPCRVRSDEFADHSPEHVSTKKKNKY